MKSAKKFLFPPVYNTNSLATIDYDPYLETEIDYALNMKLKPWQYPHQTHSTLYRNYNELNYQPLSPFPWKNPQFEGFLFNQNRGNLLYVKGSTAWLYDCPYRFPFLYKAEQCFDENPVNHLDAFSFVDPIIRQLFEYNTPIACDKNGKCSCTWISYWSKLFSDF